MTSVKDGIIYLQGNKYVNYEVKYIMQRNKSEKDISLEIVRIIALFFVLFTHTGSIGSKIYTEMEAGTTEYFMFMSLDVLRMICVPLFLMISGVLLLNREETLKEIFKRRILRFVVVLIFFSFIQILWSMYTDTNYIFDLGNIFKSVYKGEIRGSYWYLYLFLAYLLILPFLRAIAIRMNNSGWIYLLVVSTMVDVIGLVQYQYSNLYCSFYNYISFVNAYAFLYPLLGYGAYKEIQKNKLDFKKIVLLVFGLLIAILLIDNLVYSEYLKVGEYSEAHIWRFTAFMSVAIFLLILNGMRDRKIPELAKKIIIWIGNSCFGIYLFENIIESFTMKIFVALNNCTGIIIISCIIYIFSTIIIGSVFVSLIKKIPYVSKFI